MGKQLRLGEWFGKLVRKWRPAPIQLRLPPPASERKSSRPAPAEFPGNYHFFEAFLEITLSGQTYLAQPKRALLNTAKAPHLLLWGTPLHLAVPHPSIRRVRWIDDPKTGLSVRAITCPKDVLGAEGQFGDKKYRFEQVLQVTENQVVYSLVCDENQTRIAYGLPREPLGATTKAVGPSDGR